jgi:hypothetical protein
VAKPDGKLHIKRRFSRDKENPIFTQVQGTCMSSNTKVMNVEASV